MNLLEFQNLSKRTMPFGGEPANPIEFENMLGNYAMGLVGESIEAFMCYNEHELNTEEIEKELGDVLHYAVGLFTMLKIDLPKEIVSEWTDLHSHDLHLFLLNETGRISESVKRVIYHRHELDIDQTRKSLLFILELLASIADDEFLNMQQIMRTNIDKLKTRYPDKFTSEDSIKRVDTDE
ncbi:MAG: hypothetical protein ABTA23_07985 [Solibacillus sp.]